MTILKLAEVELSPESYDEGIEALRAVCRAVKEEEEGCIYIAPYVQHDSPIILVIEIYRDEEALAVHATSEPVKKAISNVVKYLAGKPFSRDLPEA